MIDHPFLMIKSEIESGKATVRSLGALYMVAMASRRMDGSFTDINEIIARWRCPTGSAAERAMVLEPVKKVAWQLYESVCRLKSFSTASTMEDGHG